MARVAQARGRFGSLARARSDRSWRGFAGGIAQIVREMPLWKLQTLRRRNVPFLYEKYCGSAMKQDPHVDHFIPWSRYPRDLAQNFVFAHSACNLDKGDMLTAPAHLAHWVKRNRELGADLAARLSPAGFLDDQPAALQVARWAYRQAEATSAQLWVSLKYTVRWNALAR